MSMDFNIHFARPDIIWKLFPYIVIASFILLYHLYKTRKVVHVLVGENRIKRVLQHYSFPVRLVKKMLFVLGMLFLVVALMRPQWNETEQTVTQEGRDLLIALDISRSMLAQDLQPDRLSFAKGKIKKLLKTLYTERLGLLLFSGSTFVQCPLTSDKAAFNMYLDSVDVETISSGTTAIEQAIKEAINIFKKMPNRKHKLLLIFTDGEDFSSNLAQIKKEASDIGMHIITVGVGTPEGAPIPLYDRKGGQVGHQHDAQGNVVISRMNEGILHRLSEDTGGVFIPIAQNDNDIKDVGKFVRSFEKEYLGDQQVMQFQEQYHYPLLVSFICFALEWLL